jgi:G3E family GTPase
MTGPIPVTLLTGYLGSGKTTLLARLLVHPQLRDTAVLVNEFGEIALDHQLLVSASETVVLMDRGCLCCALRTDLAAQLDELYSKRRRGEVPPFERVVIETTGLADPAPILQTLASEPMIAALYRLEAVVTTVDAQLGEHELDEHFESVKQAALADRIVVTKVDLVPAETVERLEVRLRALNPGAVFVRSVRGAIDPDLVLCASPVDARRDPGIATRWLRAERYRPVVPGGTLLPGGGGRAHDERIRSFAITYDTPVSGEALWRGLESLIDTRGEQLLRVKGIVNIGKGAMPKVIHIVQHVLYPVETLPAWPDDDRRTRLVFIVRDLDPQYVRDILDQNLESGG